MAFHQGKKDGRNSMVAHSYFGRLRVTHNHKIISLLPYNCNSATVMHHNVAICRFLMDLGNPCERVMLFLKGFRPKS